MAATRTQTPASAAKAHARRSRTGGSPVGPARAQQDGAERERHDDGDGEGLERRVSPKAVQAAPKRTEPSSREALEAVPTTERPVPRTPSGSIALASAARTPSVAA